MPAAAARLPARLTSRQYAALARLTVGCRIVGSDHGDPIIATPAGYRAAVAPDGRWRVISTPTSSASWSEPAA
jgi:hypothetical protein